MLVDLKKSWRNMTLMEKAAVLTSTGGQLSAENADRFIDTVVNQSEFLKKITVKRMVSNTAYIDVIAIATRQFRSAVEATLATTAQTVNASATLPRRTLTGVEVILAADISYTFLRENIERAAAEQHLMGQFATAFANDMLDLCVNGDDGSSTTFLAINNGWIDIALSDSNVNDVDVSGLSDWKEIFKQIWLGMPSAFRRMPNLAYLVSATNEMEYRYQLGERNTALGDRLVVENPPVYFNGIPVLTVYSWPDNYVMLTPVNNLHIGIQKDITVEKMLQPRKQIIEYTLTSKFDAEYAYGGMISLGAK